MAHRILFVDDERDIVDCARAYMENAGYEFEGVHDGLEAIRAVQLRRPDLVVLDVSMPRLSGWDALRILQEEPSTADIPVVMLTANAQESDKAKGWSLGCAWYHTKPFEMEELMMVIERILADKG